MSLTENAAAQLMLLVATVVARVPAEEGVAHRYSVNGHGAELSREELLAYFSTLPKPVRCTVAWDPPTLRVRCETFDVSAPSGGRALAELRGGAEALQAMLVPVAVEAQRPQVLVQGGGRALEVPVEAVIRWGSDYLCDARYAFSTRRPDRAQQDRGIGTVLTVSVPVAQSEPNVSGSPP
jgi:hypothetical protein